MAFASFKSTVCSEDESLGGKNDSLVPNRSEHHCDRFKESEGQDLS